MELTRREMNLRVFRRQPLPHVFFQPRFEPWYAWHRDTGTLPERVRGLSLPQIYDLLNASMRSVHYYTGQPDPIEGSFAPEVRVTSERQGELTRRRYDTPHGSLCETHRFTVDRTWRTLEFAAKRPEDLPALRWLVERRRLGFNVEKFKAGSAYIGDRGEAHFWVPKSPYFALAQQWMKYEDFVCALAEDPAQVEDLMRAIDESYNALYQQLCSCSLLKILNFGENIDMAYLSPRYFEKYVIPWYEKRAGQHRAAGIFTHIHIDGNFKPLLPYLRHLPFEGLEALTPLPQGDVSLEEMHEHMGDKILLDGIPAVLFLDHHPREALQECVEKIVKFFHPRLVLGISDELPQGGNEESFERLEWVSRYCLRTGAA
jgi:hypothetical protein